MRKPTVWCIVALVVVMLARAGSAPAQTAGLELTPEEQAWIEANPVIRVHNETDWPPFNFAVDGEPRGYSIDYMNLIAARVGLRVEYVTGPSWSEFLGMMRAGTLDVMLNIVRTPDREQYLLYTTPYADNPNTILSRRENAYTSLGELNGKTVSIPKGFFYEEVLSREFPDIELHLVRDTLESIKAVSFGQADAAVGELAVFNHLLERHLVSDMFVSGEVKMGDPELSLLNIATRKDLPVLASILRKAVLSVEQSEYDALRDKWVPLQVDAGIDVGLALRIGGAIAIILIVIIVWNRRLRVEATRRKEAEEQLRGIIESMSEGLICYDKDQRLIVCNSNYRMLWGYSEADTKPGTPFKDLVKLDLERGTVADPEAYEEQVDSHKKVGSGTEAYTIPLAGDRWLQVREVTTPLGTVSIQSDITERINAEQELAGARDKAKDAEALLRAVLDSMPGGVRYIDAAERIILFNKKYQELWDYPDDFPKVGITVDEEYGYHWAQGEFGEGDKDELVAKARASYPWVEGVESYERETRAGRVLEIRGQRADVGGFVTIYTDVTDRKRSAVEIEQARDKAAAAEALFKDAINNISDGFVLYDSDDHLVICNDRFRDLYQYSESVVADRPSWMDLERHDTDRNIIEWESEGEVPRGHRRWDDFQRKLTDGRWIDIRQRRTTMGGLVCIHVDITDQKRAEAIVAAARDEAERVADAKSEFVAVVSHEVRTPMNGVLGMARLLLDGDLSDDQRHLAETIVRSGDALLTIVNDLLDVSKLEAGRLELEAIPFSPHDLISQTSAALTPRAAEKGLALKTTVGDSLPAVLIGDPYRIRQILTNLLDNAIKFTDDGEISLAADAVPNGDETARLALTVSDTGAGMTAETQEKVFAPIPRPPSMSLENTAEPDLV